MGSRRPKGGAIQLIVSYPARCDGGGGPSWSGLRRPYFSYASLSAWPLRPMADYLAYWMMSMLAGWEWRWSAPHSGGNTTRRVRAGFVYRPCRTPLTESQMGDIRPPALTAYSERAPAPCQLAVLLPLTRTWGTPHTGANRKRRVRTGFVYHPSRTPLAKSRMGDALPPA